MSSWFTSLSFAILVTVIPFSFVLRLLVQLPAALALSHRRWPVSLNAIVIAAVTICIASFVRTAYYEGPEVPAKAVAGFLIAALVYAFGLVLLLRQFSGVYADFIITVGSAGLALRKTRYRNIEDVQHTPESATETRLKVRTSRGDWVNLTLPTGRVAIFFEQLQKKHSDG